VNRLYLLRTERITASCQRRRGTRPSAAPFRVNRSATHRAQRDL